MFEDVKFLTLFFAVCILICLLAYICGLFVFNVEHASLVDLIKFFGLPLGIGVGGVSGYAAAKYRNKES